MRIIEDAKAIEKSGSSYDRGNIKSVKTHFNIDPHFHY